MANLLAYAEKKTPIHKLCGVTKLVFFLAWSVVGMVIYETRVLLLMFAISLVLFKVAKIEWRQVATVFKIILVFLTLNLLIIFLFSPLQGVQIYGTRHDIVHIVGRYTLTWEQLFYEFNVLLKYFTVLPAVLMFVITTNPSEFAASLNRIGVSYKVGYAIAIALRYIPDVQSDFTKIKHAQEARGIEMSKKAKIFSRLKNMAAIIFPLVFSSMDRIDVVSNAMELRGFGKNKKRTWYSGKALERNDYIVIVFTALFSVAALVVTFYDGDRFYNPFL